MDSTEKKEFSDTEWNTVFQSIYQQYYPRLCVFATTMINDEDEAEEIVQQVIFKLWEQRDKFNTIDNLQSYLYRSVRNLCINIINHQKIEDKYKSEAWIELKNLEIQSVETESTEEQEKKLTQAIEQLPERCKEVLIMSKFEKMRNKEIAECLEVSVKAVEASITRAYSILRKLMNDNTET